MKVNCQLHAPADLPPVPPIPTAGLDVVQKRQEESVASAEIRNADRPASSLVTTPTELPQPTVTPSQRQI